MDTIKTLKENKRVKRQSQNFIGAKQSDAEWDDEDDDAGMYTDTDTPTGSQKTTGEIQRKVTINQSMWKK